MARCFFLLDLNADTDKVGRVKDEFVVKGIFGSERGVREGRGAEMAGASGKAGTGDNY